MIDLARCIGCGSCGLYGPTGAMQVNDRDENREVVFTGSPIARHPLLGCVACGRFFSTPAQRDFIGRRLDQLPPAHLQEQVCPGCSRRRQAQAIMGENPAGFP